MEYNRFPTLSTGEWSTIYGFLCSAEGDKSNTFFLINTARAVLMGTTVMCGLLIAGPLACISYYTILLKFLITAALEVVLERQDYLITSFSTSF